MTRSELMQKLVSMLMDIAPAVEISPEKSSVNLEELGYDSLDQSGLLLSIDEQLGVKIEDSEVQGLRTLDDYAALLASRV
ncbi:MAG: phosphopantetheine-binding protein [Hyphomicrobiaceae bacterium]